MQGHRCARYVVAALLVTLAACSDGTTTPATSFTADLSGEKERPTPNTTGATGTASCTIDGTNITCTLSWTGLTGNATAAHIHLGTASGTGTPYVHLCGGGGTPASSACPTGTSVTSFSSGARAVESGSTYAAVVAAMRTYGAYVNVHTAANTGGEIRGQIFGVYP